MATLSSSKRASYLLSMLSLLYIFDSLSPTVNVLKSQYLFYQFSVSGKALVFWFCFLFMSPGLFWIRFFLDLRHMSTLFWRFFTFDFGDVSRIIFLYDQNRTAVGQTFFSRAPVPAFELSSHSTNLLRAERPKNCLQRIFRLGWITVEMRIRTSTTKRLEASTN